MKQLASLALILACGCGAAATPPPAKPGDTIEASHQIIGTRAEGTASELYSRGEKAILAQDWQTAKDSFEAFIAGEPNNPKVKDARFDLALAYFGLDDQEKAREQFRAVYTQWPNDPLARSAIGHELELDAYLEDWKALGDAGQKLLSLDALTPVERMLGLGARGLSRLEAGEEGKAQTDLQDGLDLVEANHYGVSGRLPTAAAQLKFLLGEMRRVKSEHITLLPVTPDFLTKIEARCQGLLDAQNAFADAIRASDTHWAKMSGYRIGEMYRTLHRELMSIPPTKQAKTDKDKQLFYAIMHVRYRALLDKGVEMMKRTLDLAAKTNDQSSWVKKAEAAKKEMEDALVEEKAALAKLPFTEAEVEKALEIMQQHALEKEKAAQK